MTIAGFAILEKYSYNIKQGIDNVGSMSATLLIHRDMDEETKDFIKSEIGGLAGMVARGFEHADKRIDLLSTDVAILKTDVAVLKTDMTVLKTDMTALQVTVNRIDFRTQNQVDSIYEDMAAAKSDVKTVKQDIIRIKSHVGMAV